MSLRFLSFLRELNTLFSCRVRFWRLPNALIALVFYGSVVMLIGKVCKFLSRSSVAKTVKSVSGTALILLGGRLLLTGDAV